MNWIDTFTTPCPHHRTLIAALVGVAVLAGVRTVNHIRKQRRLHCRGANKRFMAGYRAGFRAAHPPVSRTTVEARSPAPRPPVVRPRPPRGVGT